MRKQKNLTYLKAFIVAVILIGIIIYFIATSPLSADAAYFDLPDAENFGDVPAPEGDDAVAMAQNLIARIMAPLRVILAAVGVALIVLYGFTLVVSARNEEAINTQKKALIYGFIGLALVSIAGSLSEIFNFQEGSFLGSEADIVERAGLFDSKATVVITFLKYIIGSIAVFAIVRSGFVMLLSGSSEEAVGKERKNLVAGFTALAFVIIGDFFVRKVMFNVVQGDNEAVVSINATAGISEIIAITNFMVWFVGPIMMLGIVAGGLMYAMAGGDEEKSGKAKKILVNSIIGAIIIYGAFALVSTIISGVF
ncbi:MAG: hypothetical protein UV80_C0002G0183 [Candidatus Peregrinibacteria bacterium GW2011_GWF2_43_17]|nr:MAG: hypothetical protein UV80_C0002G0183 [Candidatus Peregrinibacteria bacterium GW2011_GWF2_43_17]KKT20213.1 MAG: hypothetical protein UW03_C0007G0013 [Candidatus Peregrinibacteria bacterium GW2011_GWA2_43_8]